MYKRKFQGIDEREILRRYYLYVNNYYYEKSMNSGTKAKPITIDPSENKYVESGYIENYFI